MKSRALILIAVVVLTIASAFAQQLGSISGVVRDASGRVLPGVTVEVVAGVGTDGRKLVTDAQGRYSVSELPAGTYMLTFRLPGFSADTRLVTVATNSDPGTVDVVLRIAVDGTRTNQIPPFLFRPPATRQRALDPRPECLHGQNETPANLERRVEALTAMRLIYGLLDRVPVSPLGYPDWLTLARSKAVADLQATPGAAGELAKKIQWGRSEPLPGWRIVYLRTSATVTFTLTDALDPCGFSYSSNDPDVMSLWGRIVPLMPQ